MRTILFSATLIAGAAHAQPATGPLTTDLGGGSTGQCTGVLLDCQTVLTAAHCVAPLVPSQCNGQPCSVRPSCAAYPALDCEPNGPVHPATDVSFGGVPASSITVQPGFVGDDPSAVNDLAIVDLGGDACGAVQCSQIPPIGAPSAGPGMSLYDQTGAPVPLGPAQQIGADGGLYQSAGRPLVGGDSGAPVGSGGTLRGIHSGTFPNGDSLMTGMTAAHQQWIAAHLANNQPPPTGITIAGQNTQDDRISAYLSCPTGIQSKHAGIKERTIVVPPGMGHQIVANQQTMRLSFSESDFLIKMLFSEAEITVMGREVTVTVNGNDMGSNVVSTAPATGPFTTGETRFHEVDIPPSAFCGGATITVRLEVADFDLVCNDFSGADRASAGHGLGSALLSPAP